MTQQDYPLGHKYETHTHAPGKSDVGFERMMREANPCLMPIIHLIIYKMTKSQKLKIVLNQLMIKIGMPVD